MTKNNILSDSNRHLSSDDLLKFHRGMLDAENKKAIENHFTGCELCKDALTGIAEMHDAMGIYHVTHELKKRMKKRATSRKKIFSRFDIISLIMIFFLLAILLIIAAFIMYIKW